MQKEAWLGITSPDMSTVELKWFFNAADTYKSFKLEGCNHSHIMCYFPDTRPSHVTPMSISLLHTKTASLLTHCTCSPF